MACEHCNGDKPVFWKDDANCAFVNKSGEMMIVSNDKTTRFKVNMCPMCGQKLPIGKYTDLKKDDDIWYVDSDAGIIEHGKIESVYLTDSQQEVESFYVNFDDGDGDEFNGSALGKHFFTNKEEAKAALLNTRNEFDGIEDIPSHSGLAVGDDVWYVDVDANEFDTEHGKVEFVAFENKVVNWFSVKFDDGDVDEFGPNALDIFVFKSFAEAKKAWEVKHE